MALPKRNSEFSFRKTQIKKEEKSCEKLIYQMPAATTNLPVTFQYQSPHVHVNYILLNLTMLTYL